MPVWLQLAAAVTAGLAAGLMGKAFIPFLQKRRWCEPLTPKEGEEASGEQLRPALCGVLLLFGILAGLSLGFALFGTFVKTDVPEKQYTAELSQLLRLLLYGGLLAAGGFVTDVQRIRRRLIYKVPLWLQGLAVYLAALGSQMAVQEEPDLLRNAVLAVCYLLMQSTERETDGLTLTVSTVQLLFVTVLLLAGSVFLPALLSLTAAGACMGCMVWNLHPARCGLGTTGSALLGGIVPMLLMMTEHWQAVVLLMAVYAVNVLPALLRRPFLTAHMERSGMQPPSRIALLAGAAALTGVLSVLAVH